MIPYLVMHLTQILLLLLIWMEILYGQKGFLGTNNLTRFEELI